MKTSPENVNIPQSVRSAVPPINGKVIVACGLVFLMVFMWIRVFLNKGKTVKAANASTTNQPVDQAGKKEVKLIRTELEFVKGRHDALTHNMFAQKKRSMEKSSSVTVEAGAVDLQAQKDNIGNLASGLKLDAIIMDPGNLRNQVFINGKLLTAGDVLKVEFEDEVYELKVMEIFHNKVVLKWKDLTVSLKMLRADEK